VTGFHCFETLMDGRVLFTGIMQNDFNLTGAMAKIGGAAALNQIPKNMKGWHKLLAAHVKASGPLPPPNDGGNSNTQYKIVE